MSLKFALVLAVLLVLTSCSAYEDAPDRSSSLQERVQSSERESAYDREQPEAEETDTPAEAEPVEPEGRAPVGIDPDTRQYTAIIDAYRKFQNYTGDFEEALHDLYDEIAKEVNVTDAIGEDGQAYELWCSCVDARARNLGYGITDLNRDGIPELVILSDDYFVHAVYSLHNESPVLIGGYWVRNTCAIDEDGVLYVHGSGGAANNHSAAYLLPPQGTGLQLIEMVGVEGYDMQAGAPRCYRIEGGIKTIISAEEHDRERERFPNAYTDTPTQSIGLNFVPLFECAAAGTDSRQKGRNCSMFLSGYALVP